MNRTTSDVPASRPPRLRHAFAAVVAAGTMVFACGPRATTDLQERTAVEAYGVGQGDAEARRAAARHQENLERKILGLVREHRRAAPEPWRRELAEAVHRESLASGLDPLFVASIVAKESSFESRVVSRAGAVGLMQLRPWVARDVAARRDVEWRGVETLHDPELNVRLGILYLQELLERFDGDAEVALTAYNFGPTRVSRQLSRGHYRGSDYASGVLDLYRALGGSGLVSGLLPTPATPAPRT